MKDLGFCVNCTAVTSGNFFIKSFPLPKDLGMTLPLQSSLDSV